MRVDLLQGGSPHVEFPPAWNDISPSPLKVFTQVFMHPRPLFFLFSPFILGSFSFYHCQLLLEAARLLFYYWIFVAVLYFKILLPLRHEPYWNGERWDTNVWNKCGTLPSFHIKGSKTSKAEQRQRTTQAAWPKLAVFLKTQGKQMPWNSGFHPRESKVCRVLGILTIAKLAALYPAASYANVHWCFLQLKQNKWWRNVNWKRDLWS